MPAKIRVILGCFGRTDDNFVSCSGISNSILEISPADQSYEDMMDYFDTLGLFDRTLLDYNAIRRFVFNMQEKFTLSHRKLWSEKMFILYQKFIIDHKNCGLYIKLELSDS